jgi:isochorismate hydrolase
LKSHAWRIEDREYLRHEERRGRRYAYEAIEASRTALVVIDMVPFFVEPSPYAIGIVPNIDRLSAALRGRRGAVAWIVPNGAPARPDFYEKRGQS